MIATGMEDGPEPVGESLRDRLHMCTQEGLPGLPVPELLQYVSEVADALDTCSQPHGNVNPDAIRVIAGRAELTDVPAAGMSPASGPYAMSGSPSYMAPEVWRGAQTAGSDQYALACTYAELRTGRPPIHGPSVAAVMQAHLESAPDLGGCDDNERRVLMRALAKAPSQRFPTCRQWAEELRRAVAEG